MTVIQTKILVVEDDMDILHFFTYTLQSAGFKVLSTQDGYETLDKVRIHHPDLLLLDLMIPGLEGFEVRKELKRSLEAENLPVIMLTAKGEEIDCIVGLELGADDYIVKPFSPRELILRVRAILRRSNPELIKESTVWQNDGFRVDLDAHEVVIDGKETALTATEFKLLTELIRNRGKVQTRDHLFDKVWGYHFKG